MEVMSKILAVGDIYLENQFFLDKIPQENEFAFSNKVTTVIGSKIINAARVLQRLENEVSYLCRVGRDLESKNAISVLNSFGLKTNVFEDEIHQLGKIVVITPTSGKSSIILSKGANANLSTIDVEKSFNKYGNFDAVYTGTNLPLDVLYFLVHKCSQLKVPIFLDIPNQQSEIELEKVSSVDFFMPNRQETELILSTQISSVEDAKNASRKLREAIKGTIIITLDKDGCVILEKEKLEAKHVPTRQVSAIDETGAGDIFRAIFTHYYLQTRDIEKSVEFALERATASTLILGVNESLNNLNL